MWKTSYPRTRKSPTLAPTTLKISKSLPVTTGTNIFRLDTSPKKVTRHPIAQFRTINNRRQKTAFHRLVYHATFPVSNNRRTANNHPVTAIPNHRPGSTG